MVSLYEAVKLTGRLDRDDDIVYLKNDKKNDKKNDDLFGRNTPDEILTVKQLKEKYDLRRTKVVRIAPYFCCMDYEGQLLVIKEAGNGKN